MDNAEKLKQLRKITKEMKALAASTADIEANSSKRLVLLVRALRVVGGLELSDQVGKLVDQAMKVKTYAA